MNNIAKERQALGLTQEQLAKLFGWRQSRLSIMRTEHVSLAYRNAD